MEKKAISANKIISGITKRVGGYSAKAENTLSTLVAAGKADSASTVKDLAKNIKPGSVEHSGAHLAATAIGTMFPKAKTVNPIIRKYMGSKLDTASDVAVKAMSEAGNVPSVRRHMPNTKTFQAYQIPSESYMKSNPSKAHKDMAKDVAGIAHRNNTSIALSNRKDAAHSRKRDSAMAQTMDKITDFISNARHTKKAEAIMEKLALSGQRIGTGVINGLKSRMGTINTLGTANRASIGLAAKTRSQMDNLNSLSKGMHGNKNNAVKAVVRSPENSGTLDSAKKMFFGK